MFFQGSPVLAMPPKGKRRKNDISAEEQQIYDDLEALMYKYRHESEEEDGDAGMFGNDTLLVHVDSVAEIFQELDFHWDPAVLSILKLEQKTVDFSMMKLIFKTLSVSTMLFYSCTRQFSLDHQRARSRH